MARLLFGIYWITERNSVAILPLLMTPVLSNIASSIINNDQQYKVSSDHTNVISFINQILVENNECIISTSLDGVINLSVFPIY